jgi:hypothetical protein
MTRPWMTATEEDADTLMNPSGTNRMQRVISGHKGIAISILHVCTSHVHPLCSVSEASEHKSRGRNAGSSGRGKSLFGLPRQCWQGMSASCRISQLPSCRSFI